MQFLNQFAGDFGGDAGARKKLQEILETLIDNNVVSLGDVTQLVDYPFRNRAGQMTTLGKRFTMELGGLEEKAIDANLNRVEMDDKIRKAAQKEFDQQIQAAEQERKRKG